MVRAPTFYFTNPYARDRHRRRRAVPPGSAVLDFELEVAAVIGVEGRDLTPEQARDHLFGYTIFNDWSARDLQRREMKVGLGPAKGKDSATHPRPVARHRRRARAATATPTASWAGHAVAVNGTEVGQDLLSNMGWPFEELIAYASRGTRVRPGDVLGSGTCGNGGCLAELWGRRGRGPATAAAGRRRRDDGRGHRHDPQPRRRRSGSAGGSGRAAAATHPGAGMSRETGIGPAAGRVAGKVCVVTGAAQGQGLAEALLLDAEGAIVYACDLMDEAPSELRQTGVWHTGASTSRTGTTGRPWRLSCRERTVGSTGWWPTPG